MSRPMSHVLETLRRLSVLQPSQPLPLTIEERQDLREAHRLLSAGERERIVNAVIEYLDSVPSAECNEARLTRMKRMVPHALALLREA